MNITLKRIPFDSMPLDEFEGFEDRHVYQSVPWLKFLQATQNSEPVIAEVRQGPKTLGFFTGVLLRKLGVRILGSPFPGTNTPYMGFNLDSHVNRADVLPAFVDFGFNELHCHHVELSDRYMRNIELAGTGFRYRMFRGYEVDLTQGEERMFANMDRGCRAAIRKSRKKSVTVEEATDLEFADDFHAQLTEVFARSNLVPPYGVKRVKKLIEFLLPTGMLLMLRAREPGGACIATSISLGMDNVAFAWGSASLRKYTSVKPNEAIAWDSMIYWKQRGCRMFDLVGGGDYKKKYGSYEIAVPWLRMSRNMAVTLAREVARPLYDTGQKAVGTLRNIGLRMIGRQSDPSKK